MHFLLNQFLLNLLLLLTGLPVKLLELFIIKPDVVHAGKILLSLLFISHLIASALLLFGQYTGLDLIIISFILKDFRAEAESALDRFCSIYYSHSYSFSLFLFFSFSLFAFFSFYRAFAGVESAMDRFCIQSKGKFNQALSFGQLVECDDLASGCEVCLLLLLFFIIYYSES